MIRVKLFVGHGKIEIVYEGHNLQAALSSVPSVGDVAVEVNRTIAKAYNNGQELF